MKLPVAWLRDFVEPPADPAEIGAKLAACGFEVASIDGDVIDVEVTANRPDCLSVYGLAREVATAFDLGLRSPGYPFTPSAAAAGFAVAIESAECGRYALVLADVRIAPSPAWLAERLTAAGVRPINNVVDASNYVMMEMGHPTHAFDAATLAGNEIHVRAARAGEHLKTLDGQTRALDPKMLVIADRDRAVALAGVMGGLATEVSGATTRIAIESAWFLPASVRTTGRRLNLKSEAAARFERGADIDAPVRALHRILALLEQIGAGRAASVIIDNYPSPVSPRLLTVDRQRVARLLGETVPDAEVERILNRLGLGAAPTPEGWHVVVPTFRVDVAREADIAEDIARHWGFDRIPATFPSLTSAPRPNAPSVARDRMLRRILCGAGLQEAVTFTFIEQASAAPFVLDAAALVAIANPLSEKFAVLRPSLLPGLLDALVYNRRRETRDVRLFEAAAVFGPEGDRPAVGWMLSGHRDDHWGAAATPIDFFDAKGVAELIGDACRASIDAESASADQLPWFVPGRAAHLVARTDAGAVTVGAVGQIRPDIAAARGLGQSDPVFGGEIDLTALVACATPAGTIAPLPRHPSIVRDLSVLVSERVPASALRATIRASAPAILAELREFDRYAGKGVPAGQISLSLRLTFRHHDRTLTDAEVQQSVDHVIAALAREHGATLRGAVGA